MLTIEVSPRMQFVALIDIDHTVSNAFWRDAMFGGDWDEYHAASVDDLPMIAMIEVVKALHSMNWLIVGITARPSKWRKMTMEWLLKNEAPFDELLMRDDEDYRPAPELKIALALSRFGDDMKEKVTVVFDDREDVIEAFKARGVTAVQVHGVK